MQQAAQLPDRSFSSNHGSEHRISPAADADPRVTDARQTTEAGNNFAQVDAASREFYRAPPTAEEGHPATRIERHPVGHDPRTAHFSPVAVAVGKHGGAADAQSLAALARKRHASASMKP